MHDDVCEIRAVVKSVLSDTRHASGDFYFCQTSAILKRIVANRLQAGREFGIGKALTPGKCVCANVN